LIDNIKQNSFGCFDKYKCCRKIFSYCSTAIKFEDRCFGVKDIKNIVIFNKVVNIFKQKDTITEILIFILIVYLKYKIIIHYEINKNREYCFLFFKTILNIIKITLPEGVCFSLYFPYVIKYSYLRKKIFIFYKFLLDFIKKFVSKYNFKIKIIFMNLINRSDQVLNIF